MTQYFPREATIAPYSAAPYPRIGILITRAAPARDLDRSVGGAIVSDHDLPGDARTVENFLAFIMHVSSVSASLRHGIRMVSSTGIRSPQWIAFKRQLIVPPCLVKLWIFYSIRPPEPIARTDKAWQGVSREP